MSKTGIFLVIISIILGIYDLFAYSSGGLDYTISRFLLGSAIVAPLIPFSIGFLCGHMFGRMKLYCDNCKKKIKE